MTLLIRNDNSKLLSKAEKRVTSNIDIFRKEFLEANSWAQRRDGVPLYLLDNLTTDEIKVAEAELIKIAGLKDDWPILGLGHIKSTNALPILYKLLYKSKGVMRVKIAHSIFKISQDSKMIDLVLEAMPKITGEYELIDVLYYLPGFKEERITDLHHCYTSHKEYLVAYNATRYLGLPTDEVVERFRKKKKQSSIWDKLFGR